MQDVYKLVNEGKLAASRIFNTDGSKEIIADGDWDSVNGYTF